MKLIEAITRIDELKHNTIDKTMKLSWLAALDGMVKQQIIDTHAGGEGITFTPYTEETPDDTQLLIPAPYEELYLWWLGAQIDYHNGDFTRYNNSIAMFNTAMDVYAELYNRCHMPLGRRSFF